MIISHWIDNELVTIDTEDVWLATFLRWEALVPTEIAAAIATATVRCLEAADTVDTADRRTA